MKLKELKVGTKFKYAGYEFTKLADEKKSCYCLLNDKVFDGVFGKTNDWAKSPIRKRLNEFDDAGNSLVLPKITKDDLVPVSLNYTAYKIPNGRSTDYITCLSYEEYLAYGFPILDKCSWLRSGVYYSPSHSYVLTSSGANAGTFMAASLAVRPALHFVADIEVDITDTVEFLGADCLFTDDCTPTETGRTHYYDDLGEEWFLTEAECKQAAAAKLQDLQGCEV